MSEEQKPREFWLYKETAILCENRKIKIHNQPYFYCLVLKETYDQLLTEALKLKNSLLAFIVSAECHEWNDVEPELEQAREALASWNKYRGEK